LQTCFQKNNLSVYMHIYTRALARGSDMHIQQKFNFQAKNAIFMLQIFLLKTVYWFPVINIQLKRQDSLLSNHNTNLQLKTNILKRMLKYSATYSNFKHQQKFSVTNFSKSNSYKRGAFGL
jgi:hypothetical protein